MFIFMGTMLERSGVAKDLLSTLQIVTRRIPGGLAMSVTLMGTIMAATTGIVGASVVMLTMIALPSMMERGYSKELATGTIASAGTLGILIPPSIMLVIMGDLLSVSVGAPTETDNSCLLYTSPSPRDGLLSRMPSSA